ncbi:rCG63197 [Rattus norvegicus]|uniref:RCG63197 n=1 Tax=Rattus norvegicus TaxID=10116 RepID=A6K9P0_RAT|nr:rCG63197 [Rattus norvegicus]
MPGGGCWPKHTKAGQDFMFVGKVGLIPQNVFIYGGGHECVYTYGGQRT